MFGRLFLFVALGALLGGIIEGRCWYMAFATTLGRITRAARLPDIVGMAMPAALASGPAADSMLVAGHREGAISRSALIAGGMANSFLAYLSHSIRVMYPVIAAIGIPGALYFGIHITGGILLILAVFAWNRFRVGQKAQTDPVKQAPLTSGPAETVCPPGAEEASRKTLAAETAAAVSDQPAAPASPKILPWKETLHKGILRAATLIFRLACISVPLILAMEMLIRTGCLDFWDRVVPEAVSRYFPEQILAIVAAQLGGLVQSSAVSAGLYAQGLITGPQILLAMLVASLVSNPFRMLRRNLPTALAIFPASAALTIVLSMQLARMLITLIGAAGVILWMR